MTVLLLIGAIAGCAGSGRLPAVPNEATERAKPLGMTNARFWADTDGPAMIREAVAAAAREQSARPARQAAPEIRTPASYLAVSGGSDNGAFGAGLLVGWTASGRRPEFKLVTGVSTGALIAPFAFLGPSYDPRLRAVYTMVSPDDIYEQRWLPTAVFGDALAGTDPLFKLISRYADERMLEDIAREYRKGRLLLIGTTNLDVQRPVIWNIGAIAASGNPGALDLFHKILLASASVPGAFPPVMIDVELDGRHCQEMHVDGGAIAQTFLIPSVVGQMVDLRAKPYARERTAYVIRNARLDPEWASVDRRLLTIAGRAIATMIHYSGYNDVVRIYFAAERDGIDYNLAYIGRDFSFPHSRNFDTDYMRALFGYGFAKGRGGSVWYKQPPIFAQPDGSEMLGPDAAPRATSASGGS
ncbi:MAG: patatin-like phospholipase family protein [Alphaproteobacteria bacterium]|nr:patatin-like phospholipase family protein [Alphaproteobacteria bacterium]